MNIGAYSLTAANTFDVPLVLQIEHWGIFIIYEQGIYIVNHSSFEMFRDDPKNNNIKIVNCCCVFSA